MTTHATAPSTKRQAIMETAERLFADCGYDATSTARIAHEAGVPSGLVFYHFATKTDLLLSIVRERPTPSQVLRTAARGSSVHQRLRAVVTVMAEELDRNRAVRLIVFREAQARPEIAARAAELFTEAAETVAEVLSGADDIAADPARVRTAAELIVSSVFLDIIALGRSVTAADRHAAMIDMLEESLTAPR